MNDKALTGETVQETPENWANHCQVYGRRFCPPGGSWHENRSWQHAGPGLPQIMFVSTESAKRAREVRHKPKRFQKEERIPSRYLWRGILVVVLGAALVKSAAAYTGIVTEATGSRGFVMSHSLEDIAAVLVIALVYLHELSRIFTLCQFAAPVRQGAADATNDSTQPPRHRVAGGPASALSRAAKKSTAEMSLLATLVSLSRKFG
jgi:hypothetical protein